MSTGNKELDCNVKTFKKYRNLLKELTAKNVKLKYRNSWLGILWSFIQPLLQMIVLSVVFGGIFGKSNKHVVCFPVYLFTGRLLFSFFTSSTKQAMTSFRRNASIIKKVYVPKYMYPLSSIFSNFVTFAISLLCLICVWIFFKLTGISGGSNLHITPYVFMSIVPMFLLLIFCTGVGLILSVYISEMLNTFGTFLPSFFSIWFLSYILSKELQAIGQEFLLKSIRFIQ